MQREMLDKMHRMNAETVHRIAKAISARLDALEAGEVVMPLIRRPAVADPAAPEHAAYALGYKAAQASCDAVWARVGELETRVRALIEARPKPRIRVGAGVEGGRAGTGAGGEA